MKTRVIILLFLLFSLIVSPSFAQTGQVLGIHVLHTYEIDQAADLVRVDDESWSYITIPFSFEDIEKKDQWQTFFDKCKEYKIIPLVRLVTKPEGSNWRVPNKKDIVLYANTLSSLEWPTNKRHVIIFNEPNHAQEWGGKIDPASYAQILKFSADWFHTEGKNYVVLPAGLDLAADGYNGTREAFSYWKEALTYDPNLLTYIDAWNSHSYPNPGFSSSPEKTTKNSLRGFVHERAFFTQYIDKDFEIYITETGWVQNGSTNRWLSRYYQYAIDNIWSDPKVVAVTPFLLNGSPGPFTGFSFLNEQGEPTTQYLAYRKIIESIQK